MTWQYAEYANFAVNSEADHYRLASADGYSGTAGDAFNTLAVTVWKANHMEFSTVDNDVTTRRCAKFSGWWFQQCSASNINDQPGKGIWTASGTAVFDVVASRMLVSCP